MLFTHEANSKDYLVWHDHPGVSLGVTLGAVEYLLLLGRSWCFWF